MNDEYQNFFNNKEYLESVYNMLKGEEKELKRENIRKLIQMIEGVEYEDVLIHNENSTKNENGEEILNFDEFCEIFKKIYENSQNPRNLFLDGFAFLDKNKKGYIDIDDLKKINSILNQHFSEDDLEGLLEIAGKSDSKITFENFIEFLNNENS
jgi:Ca2+-binding EF-hand superfamily protein